MPACIGVFGVRGGGGTALAAATLTVAATGCTAGEETRLATTRDSAGMTIVENDRPRWTQETAWRLSERPLLDIGTSAGDPAYELHEPRDALVLGDGRIVVANAGSREIRYFAPDGRHLLSIGGEGGGPGEFRRLSWMGKLEGDSIAVYDQTQRRLTIFDPAGRHARDLRLAVGGAVFPMIGGRFSDGSYLGSFRVRPPRRAALPEGLGRDSLVLLRFGPRGDSLDVVGPFPNRVYDVRMRAIGARTIRGPADVAFSPRTVWALGADRVYVGSSDRYEFRVLDRDGAQVRLLRRTHQRRDVTDGDRALLVHTWRTIHDGNLSNPEVQYFLHTLEQSPLPSTLPVFDPIDLDDRGRRIGTPVVVDALGNLWVSQYRRLDELTPVWDVFDPAGRFLGSVTMPQRFLVSEIGADYVLGTWRSELLVGHVRLYALIRPE